MHRPMSSANHIAGSVGSSARACGGADLAHLESELGLLVNHAGRAIYNNFVVSDGAVSSVVACTTVTRMYYGYSYVLR